MNKLAPLVTAGMLVACLGGAVANLRAQSSELGALPPMPDLDLGDPEEKMSLRDKLEANRESSRRERETSRYERQPGDTGAATIAERMEALRRQKAQQQRSQRATEVTVRNEVDSSDDAMTPSGSRLQPFGEEGDFWGPMPEPKPEERLAVLPPMPDLRTPEQKTWRDRARERRVAKVEQRKAEAEAKRRQQEQQRRARVRRPGPDPEDALVQVQARSESGAGYVGNRQAPETVDQGNLKPFNRESAYYDDDGQLVYKGDKPDRALKLWWERGTSEPGGGEEDDGSIFRWRNPFKETRDDVQPVSYTQPSETRGHSGTQPSRDSTPLTSNLRGIRVIPSTREVAEGAISGVSGVSTEGVDLPPKVRDVLESRVNQSLTLGGLNQMVRDAVVGYRKSDMPVVDVLVPEQEVTGGVLQLVIIEGRLGDVIVEGANSERESRALASQIRTERGEVIRESDLTEDLAWMNKHPTRQVDLVFNPGDDYGETDVILRSEAYQELSAFIAYENSGTRTLGENRALFGTSWTGPLFFGLDSILSYQFTTNFADGNSDLFGHSGVFSSYLPWRHQLTLLGAYVDSSAFIPNNAGAGVNTGGVNKQGSIRYGIPLPNIGSLTHELELGMDFKSSNSALSFNQAQVFDTTSEIVQYSLGYNIVARDQTGTWRVDSEVVSSPGKATNKNRDAIFQTQRAGSSANYTYGRVRIERNQELPQGWSMTGRLEGQASNRNLLASETLGAGGYDTVRGFEQRVARGDSGVVGSLELRTPTFYPSTFAGFGNVQDGAFGLLFWDAGSLSSADPLVGEVERNLGSVGLGFRYQKDNWFTLRVDYGFQVTEKGFNDDETGRWHVGARATF